MIGFTSILNNIFQCLERKLHQPKLELELEFEDVGFLWREKNQRA